ncbi:leukocyte elastase inhibitor-like [Oppia nitens]|uniref:leukocyte elastase inhibitor-like n=1 Tax=Oppia nitens TaxID=1686743 RepID=UPI0023D9A8C8|nr:leukocyte elastase inhibitor-like [Oppia nitens]
MSKLISFLFSIIIIINCLLFSMMTTNGSAVQSATNQTANSYNKLGLKLLNQLFKSETTNDKKTNLIISPISVLAIIAMLYHGSNGKTREELGKTLNIGLDDDIQLRKWWKSKLMSINNNTDNKQVLMANGVFISDTFKLGDNYQNIVKNFYDSLVKVVNFGQQESIDSINSYIADKTGGQIDQLITSVTPNTVMLLVNALHFKGKWATPFAPQDTKPEPFNNYGRNKVMVPTMKIEKQKYNFIDDEKLGFKMLGMAYEGNRLDFYIILPKTIDSHSIKRLLSSLTIDTINKKIQSATEQDIDLWLPKFTIESDIELKTSLKSLGLTHTFTSKADFSKINGNKGLYVSDFIHKCVIQVNEEGTEASAASAVDVVMFSSLPPETIEIKVDRPFIYFIRQRDNGVYLFMGVTDHIDN